MEKLSQYLEQKKIRQTDFAARCGVTQASISRLVRGAAQPSPQLAKKIEAETLGAVRYFDWPEYRCFAPEPHKEAG